MTTRSCTTPCETLSQSEELSTAAGNMMDQVGRVKAEFRGASPLRHLPHLLCPDHPDQGRHPAPLKPGQFLTLKLEQTIYLLVTDSFYGAHTY